MSVNYCSSRPSTAQLEALYSGVGWSLYLAPGLLDACLDGSLWFETAWAPSDAESSSGEEPPEWPDGRPGAGPAAVSPIIDQTLDQFGRGRLSS